MPVGETNTPGYQFEIRKTVPIPSDKVWQFLFSEQGVSLWLGKLKKGAIPPVGAYTTFSGIEGDVKVFEHLSHIKLTWKPENWTNETILQLRVIPLENKTTIAIRQEKLLDSNQRGKMKTYWTSVLDRLTGGMDPEFIEK